MTVPKPGWADYGMLLLLAAFWGGSFLFIKIGVDTITPLTLTFGRLLIGAIAFAGILAATGRSLPQERSVLGLLAIATVLGLVVPFVLISWGEQRIDSGLAAILMAGMPLMTLVLARLFADEELTPAKFVGVLCGVAGLVVLIGPENLSRLGTDTMRQLAIVLASLCYAVNALVLKKLSRHDPYAVSTALMVFGAVLMLPVCVVFDRPWTLAPSAQSVLSMVILGLFSTAAASLLVFAILRRQGAGFFSQINFLVPLFGVAWGFAVLSERPPSRAFVALAIIFAGIALSRSSLFGRSGGHRPPVLEIDS